MPLTAAAGGKIFVTILCFQRIVEAKRLAEWAVCWGKNRQWVRYQKSPSKGELRLCLRSSLLSVEDKETPRSVAQLCRLASE